MPDKYSIGLSKRYPAMPTAPTGSLPPPGSSCRGGRERICLCFSGHSMQNAVQMRQGKTYFVPYEAIVRAASGAPEAAGCMISAVGVCKKTRTAWKNERNMPQLREKWLNRDKG